MERLGASSMSWHGMGRGVSLNVLEICPPTQPQRLPPEVYRRASPTRMGGALTRMRPQATSAYGSGVQARIGT